MRGIKEEELDQKHIDQMIEVTNYGNKFSKEFREKGMELIAKGFRKECVDAFLDMVLLDILNLYIDLHGYDFEKITSWLKFKYEKNIVIAHAQ